MAFSVSGAAVGAAVKVAGDLGIASTDPVVLADGANVIVHLQPSPVVAKVAASTPEVRPDSAAWLQRELDVAAFLTEAGAPVLPPSPEVRPTTYLGDGHVMSFWRYLRSVSAEPADEDTIGAMLRDLHAALRSYPGALTELAPLADIPAYLARPQTRVSAGQAAALAAAYARLTAELDPTSPRQPLHGDAGPGNLMATDTGWVWNDFEDTCSGPVTWDLAASTANPRRDRARILAAYGTSAVYGTSAAAGGGTGVDAAQLAVCEQLRRLHLTIWYGLYAERFPDLRARADELLALWPVP